MTAAFEARLVNGPLGDPALFVGLRWARRALLFDLGNLQALEPVNILKVSDAFISHTHLDHFIGFDHLVRVALNREKTLRLFGPPGIIAQVEGKLAGYTWNLVEDYRLRIVVREVHADKVFTAAFACADRWQRREEEPPQPFTGTLLEEPLFSVRAVHLDHGIPCLGFAVAEPYHLNIDPVRLGALGLPVGPWLGELKAAIRAGRPDDTPIAVPVSGAGGRGERTLPLGLLRHEVVRVPPGQKLAYVTDVVHSPESKEKIVALARGADLFFCEAAYLQEEDIRARERHHLTARQAGLLAREAGVKRLTIFHFSPKHRDEVHQLYREAAEAFGSPVE